jgi:hypothetical protein
MLVFLIIAAVLIGLAYADFCLIDNTEHFGAGEAQLRERTETVASMWNYLAEQAEVVPPATGGTESADENGTSAAADHGKSPYLRPRPVPEPLLLLDLEPVLELYEAS